MVQGVCVSVFLIIIIIIFFSTRFKRKKRDRYKSFSFREKRKGGGDKRRRSDIRSVLSEFVLNNVFTFDRGGVSLETEKGKNGTTSKLLITRAQHDDSGNYTCVSSKVAANVMVHVLNGENKIIEHTTLLLPTKSSREGRGGGGGRGRNEEPTFFLPSNCSSVSRYFKNISRKILVDSSLSILYIKLKGKEKKKKIVEEESLRVRFKKKKK